VLLPAGDVYPVNWFPDSTQLLVSKWDGSLWKLSVLTGGLTKLRSHVGAASVSPDGARILFEDTAAREVWVLGSNGESAHHVMTIEPADSLATLTWAPTGQRFSYVTNRRGPDAKMNTLIESRATEGSQAPTVIVANEEPSPRS
jgi:Tol biopolymer transport system component